MSYRKIAISTGDELDAKPGVHTGAVRRLTPVVGHPSVLWTTPSIATAHTSIPSVLTNQLGAPGTSNAPEVSSNPGPSGTPSVGLGSNPSAAAQLLHDGGFQARTERERRQAHIRLHQEYEKVTGSNQGIGFEIVKNLCLRFPGIVFLTSRDVAKGKVAVTDLNKLSHQPKYSQLDILDNTSIKKFSDLIRVNYGGIDILVNNAAIACQMDSKNYGQCAEQCLATNYYGLKAVCLSLFPLLRPHARVVNMASCEGHLTRIPGAQVRARLSDPGLTEECLDQLVEEYLYSAKKGTHIEDGWGHSAYRVSKCAVCALTFIQQQAMDKDSRPDIIINAVHPGFCSTNITRFRGRLTAEQGADAPTYLALLPPNSIQPRGQFVWKDRTVVSWTEPLKERI